ncbi:capsular biosynthesis protein [Sphingomonas sp. HITSZ_GF]|uniref:capsule biosynthesis protein n=1 Tax=Sphingomonas sp. HITSZ_GF TaxID=3037247 RepID=UPI00240D4B29|nr:capsular biosynthesis protein [Sphingomonas sp. HITSZ_GF]MDG2533781.1 capsular biosynthesis protein [Sphingomonas sp. HITSZ_GF]
MPVPPAARTPLRLVERPRHFLFLQGLPGPFFRRLGRHLRERGSTVSRVNFSGGDWWDWPGGTGFRGAPADFPAWLERFVAERGVSDIVVFGDCRAPHVAARALADRRGLRFHAFEEGYLRPDHVTLERGGVNGHSSFPRSLHALRLLDARIEQAGEAVAVRNDFAPRAREAVLHHVFTLLGRPRFPHHRNHRFWPAWREAAGWLGRRLRRRRERRASLAALAGLAGRPIFLLPLQIEGDSQLAVHSPFASIVEAMEHVLQAFRAAPPEARLLVKQHPLDPGVVRWRALVTEAAHRIGVGDKVAFIERGDLLPLLRVARGVVTINSTVGPLALAEGVPVLAMGAAIYRMEGITAECSLAEFWRDPPPVVPENFALLCRVLRAKCLVNGGFHSAAGLDLLVRGSAERLLA